VLTLLLVALAYAVLALPLAVFAGRRLRDPWGPEGDQPIGYDLTDRGRNALDHPTTYLLDEDNETWGPV
jgi:hypothetical protein